MERLKLGIVTCGFLGLAPFAPGTFGTLAGVLIAWLLAPTAWFPLWMLAAIGGLYALGRWLGAWAERRAGGEDPGFFVLDEACGFLLTVLWVAGPSPLTLVVGFCVFRFFDIWKPALARRLEKLHGGDGIMLDDVISGLYGLALVMLPLRLFVQAPWNVAG